MKKYKVGMVLVSCLLTMILLLTACGGGEQKSQNTTVTNESSNNQSNENQSNQSENKDPVKLNVWIAGSGEAAFDEAYRAVLDAYTANNTNVSYELSFISWTEYFTKLNTGLIGGAGPDIFMLGYGQLGTVVDMGNLLALDEYIPSDWDGKTDFYENMLKVGQKDGVQYALFQPSTRVFLYRKDIAEQNGVTEEDLHIKTQEDLFELARKMTVYDKNNNVILPGLEVDPDSEQTFFTYSSMLSDDIALWNDDLTAAFNNETTKQAYSNLYSLYQEGVVSLMDPSTFSPGVSLGTTAISLGPESYYAVADAAFPGEIGVLKNDMNTLLIGNFLAVNSATKYPEEAVDMLLHMFSKESAATYAEVATQYSGRQSLDDLYVELNPDMENVVYAYGKSIPYSYAMNHRYTAAVVKLRTQLDSVFQGEDVETAINKATEEWNIEVSK